jgi:hypothetical protein
MAIVEKVNNRPDSKKKDTSTSRQKSPKITPQISRFLQYFGWTVN